jgi:hypothetical protein
VNAHPSRGNLAAPHDPQEGFFFVRPSSSFVFFVASLTV